MLNAVADPNCSTILFHGRIPGPATLAIGLAQGNLLWRKDFNDQYLSMRGDVVYAMQPPNQPGPAPGQLLSIAAADGGTVGSDLGAAPLAFTADGSPVFAELSDPAVCDPPPASPTAPPAVRSPSPSPRASAPAVWPTLPESCGVTVWVGRTSR